MPRIQLNLTLWRRDRDGEPIEADRLRSERSILAFLEAMVCHDVGLLEADPSLPGLYESGIRYQRERPPEGAVQLADALGVTLRTPEEWRDIPACLAAGHADCEDLATYRAAELRARQGVEARAVIRGRWSPVDRRWVYHVVTAYPDGTIEDPSALLGMRGEA